MPRSRILQVALFATGCSGIVTEFVLSTLATYLIGNATLQWTLIMSLMLFAMGVGSRLSRLFTKDLLDTFLLVEFSLSCLCAVAAALCFGLSFYVASREIVIYPLALGIGALIGLEIPIVTRLNSLYQELRTNISMVLEMDYYGSLLGGILFAFVFLPWLGLAITPVVLGGINFSVASCLLWRHLDLVRRKTLLALCFGATTVIIVAAAFLSRPILVASEQKKYKDTIVYSHQSLYQKIVMTRWKSHYWLFINGQEQFSSVDEHLYHEPLVHPAMAMAANRGTVLILGGGDGLAAREVLKYPDVRSVFLVDLDPAMTDLGSHHPVLKALNRGSLSDTRLRIVNRDASAFLDEAQALFDVVIVDLPDPDTMDIMHLYSRAFYRNVLRHLARGGVMVTQASSPFFSRKAFLSIYKTMGAAGFSTLAYHNPVPTLGEWGWVLGVDGQALTQDELKTMAGKLDFEGIETRFISNDAMVSMIHFGKGLFEDEVLDGIGVNTEADPVLHLYYRQGTWGIY